MWIIISTEIIQSPVRDNRPRMRLWRLGASLGSLLFTPSILTAEVGGPQASAGGRVEEENSQG